MDINDLQLKIADFHSIVNEIKPASDSSDQEIKESMLNISKWEQYVKEINDLKLKLDKDVIDLDKEPESYITIKARYGTLLSTYELKVRSIREADKEQSLYLLNKAVKETAVYPAAFSGQANQNIFKFKEKFLNTLETNQIRK